MECEYEFEEGDEVVFVEYEENEDGEIERIPRAGRILDSPPWAKAVGGPNSANRILMLRESNYRVEVEPGIWRSMMPDQIIGPRSVLDPEIDTL